MARTHIPHDAQISNYVVMATNSLIGGGCILNDFVYVGLNSHIHQWLCIGEGAMLGMNSAIIKNIPPFLTVVGVPAKILKVNEEGLKRRNFMINEIKEFKNFLALKEIKSDNSDNILIKKYNNFISKYENTLELK
jgi:UDP-N-acetylglucosamine acyltransferase